MFLKFLVSNNFFVHILTGTFTISLSHSPYNQLYIVNTKMILKNVYLSAIHDCGLKVMYETLW